MIAADTSALIAVLTREEGYEIFADAIKSNGPALVSAATAVEFLIVAMGRGNGQG